jgi:hypothetical protein
MPQGVHGHPFSREERVAVGCGRDISGQPTLNRVAAEGASGPCREQWGSGLTGALGKPDAQNDD